MQQIILPVIAIIAGLSILGWSTNRFVEGASRLARSFDVSPMIVGLTIVAFCTSTPEILISLMAALQGKSDIAIGNAIGSNISNIALVAGVVALITPVTVYSQTLRRELSLMLLVMIVALMLIWDGTLSRFDGLLLLAGMVILIFWIVHLSRRTSSEDTLEAKFSTNTPDVVSTRNSWWYLFSGLMLLLMCSRLLVWGASSIAYTFGVNDLIIGLTIVAVGSSLPELAASVVAARKGKYDIVIGNVVGSNLFNTLAALGITGIIGPSKLNTMVLIRDFPLMIGLSIALYLMARGKRNHAYGRIQRWEGGLLLAVFISYQVWLFFSITPQTSF